MVSFSSQGRGPLSRKFTPVALLLGFGVLLGTIGNLAGCAGMSARWWDKSGGGFVRIFGDSGPGNSPGPATVSEWMGQPRPQP